MLLNRQDALDALDKAWSQICEETMRVLGGELHYQAMIYRALTMSGEVPLDQIGMNVKQAIRDIQTPLFRARCERRAEGYRGNSFEPIPDVVIFSPKVEGDWRRRSYEHTLQHMLVVIEVKASERRDGRVQPGEVVSDLRKLDAHRQEAQFKSFDFHPVMLVVDLARKPGERMTKSARQECREEAHKLGVEWRYISPEENQVDKPSSLLAARMLVEI